MAPHEERYINEHACAYVGPQGGDRSLLTNTLLSAWGGILSARLKINWSF